MTTPMDAARSLRCQASRFMVLADAVDGMDHETAAVAREEALQLNCRAAVIEQLSELYDELGRQARACSDFAMSLRRLA